jgi:hypothetical protein
MKYDANQLSNIEKLRALKRAKEGEHTQTAHAPYGKNDYRLDDDVTRKSGSYDNDTTAGVIKKNERIERRAGARCGQMRWCGLRKHPFYVYSRMKNTQ